MIIIAISGSKYYDVKLIFSLKPQGPLSCREANIILHSVFKVIGITTNTRMHMIAHHTMSVDDLEFLLKSTSIMPYCSKDVKVAEEITRAMMKLMQPQAPTIS